MFILNRLQNYLLRNKYAYSVPDCHQLFFESAWIEPAIDHAQYEIKTPYGAISHHYALKQMS